MNITSAHAFYEFGRQQSSFASYPHPVGGTSITAGRLLMGLGELQTNRSGVVENNGYTELINVDVPFFIEAIVAVAPAFGETEIQFEANSLGLFAAANGRITAVNDVSVSYPYIAKDLTGALPKLTGMSSQTAGGGAFQPQDVARFPVGARVRFGDFSSSTTSALENVAQTNSIICGFEFELKSLGASAGTDFSNFDFILERNPIGNTSVNSVSVLDEWCKCIVTKMTIMFISYFG